MRKISNLSILNQKPRRIRSFFFSDKLCIQRSKQSNHQFFYLIISDACLPQQKEAQCLNTFIRVINFFSQIYDQKFLPLYYYQTLRFQLYQIQPKLSLMDLPLKQNRYSIAANQMVHEGEENLNTEKATHYQRSQLYQIEYLPLMKDVFQPTIQSLKNICRLGGVQFEQCWKENLSNRSNVTVETDWQSALSTFRIGKLKTNLFSIRLKMKHQPFTKKLDVLGQGNFGQIYLFHLGQHSFALKNIILIKNNDSDKHINSIMMEIATNKIASALKVGIYFANPFGYQAIIFQDSILFAMQLGKNLNQIQQLNLDSLQKDLMQSLKILHFYQICHLDIKNDNILWSPTFGKFVFSDFGFSRFIKNQPGFKTQTLYKGTLFYSSPEMKKIYYFKTPKPVDLYYNDLHALLMTIKKVRQIIKQRQQNRQDSITIFYQAQFLSSQRCDQEQEDDKMKQQVSFFDYFHRYISFKFCLFTQQCSQLIQRAKSEVKLCSTFRKLTLIRLQKPQRSQKFERSLQMVKKIMEEKQKQKASIDLIDAFFLQYTFRHSESNCLTETYIKLIELSKSRDLILLDQIWKAPQGKNKIFEFLQLSGKEEPQFQKNMVRHLYQLLKGGISSNLEMMRELMIQFVRVYVQEKDCIRLEKIMAYFLLRRDWKLVQQIQMQILSILEGRKADQPENYLIKNLQFYLGKKLLSKWDSFIQAKSNWQNIKKINNYPLANQSFQNLAKQTNLLISVIQEKFSFDCFFFKKDYLSYKQAAYSYLRSFEYDLTEDIVRIIQSLLITCSETQQKIQVTDINNYQSSFIKSVVNRYQILTSIQQDQLQSLRRFLSLQSFSESFPFFQHMYDPNLHMDQRSKLAKEYLPILKSQPFHFQQKDLIYLEQNLISDTFKSFFIDFFKPFTLPSPSDFQAWLNLTKKIEVMLNFTNIKHSIIIQEQESLCDYLEQYLLKSRSVLDLCLSEKNPIRLKEIEFKIKTSQALIYESKNIFHQSALISFYLLDQYKRIKLVSPLLRIKNRMAADLRVNVQKKIFDFFCQVLKYNRFEMLESLYQIYDLCVPLYIREYGLNQTFHFLKSYAIYILNSKLNPIENLYFRVCDMSIKGLSQREKAQFLIDIIKRTSLIDLRNYFILLPLIFQLYITQKDKLNSKIVQRVLRISIFYIESLKEGYYRTLKRAILKQGFRNHKEKKRTKRVSVKEWQKNKFDEIGAKEKKIVLKERIYLKRIRQKLNQYLSSF